MFDEMNEGSGGGSERYSWIRVKYLIHSYAEALQSEYPQLTYTTVFSTESEADHVICLHVNMRMIRYCVYIWSKISVENCSDYSGVLFNLTIYTTRFYQACGLELIESQALSP